MRKAAESAKKIYAGRASRDETKLRKKQKEQQIAFEAAKEDKPLDNKPDLLKALTKIAYQALKAQIILTHAKEGVNAPTTQQFYYMQN